MFDEYRISILNIRTLVWIERELLKFFSFTERRINIEITVPLKREYYQLIIYRSATALAILMWAPFNLEISLCERFSSTEASYISFVFLNLYSWLCYSCGYSTISLLSFAFVFIYGLVTIFLETTYHSVLNFRQSCLLVPTLIIEEICFKVLASCDNSPFQSRKFILNANLVALYHSFLVECFSTLVTVSIIVILICRARSQNKAWYWLSEIVKKIYH